MNSKKNNLPFEERPDDEYDADDQEEEVYDDDDDEGDEEEDEGDEGDEGEYDGEGGMDFEMDAMEETLAAFLTTEDGDNVATALMSISDNVQNLTKAMETQNKILVKIATHIAKK